MKRVEIHPLPPFLPSDARLLMLGTFPPKQERWCMDFFYPNFQNDMWRIFGLIFFGDHYHFIRNDEVSPRFDKPAIINFLQKKKIALYDTAISVVRLKDNASDASLKIVQTADLSFILSKIPQCTAIASTGKKASDILSSISATSELSEGESVCLNFEGRNIKLYRMPSSSRAYPKRLSEKAKIYAKMFASEEIL